MNTLPEKIGKQSRVILVLAKITRILLYVILGVAVFALISTWISGETPIFKLGNTEVYATLPLGWLFGVELNAETARQLADLRADLAVQIFAIALSQIMLTMIIRIFSRIRDNKDPFEGNVIRPMKSFAALLGLVIAVQNLILGTVVALSVFAFAMIFQYGAQLKTQVDETL
jgi:hypothetical protein